MSNRSSTMAPLIAVIGCDGSGKSTVSEHTLDWVKGYGPAATAHLGKQQGNIGRSLAKLPLLGKLIDRYVERKVATVHSSYTKNKTPGILTALVIYAFSLRRLKRFRRMLALRKKGFIIITDRFPQLDFPRAYDGPDLDIKAEGNFVVRWLARREQRLFEWMTSHQPDLVVRLNVDLDTACERKPDHLRERLRRKVEITPLLTFNGAPIAEIDTTLPLEDVLAAAKEAVTRILTERGYKRENP